MFWAALFSVLALLLAKSLFQAFATGTVGVRTSTYRRDTQPGVFWLATVLQLGLMAVAIAIVVMSLRHSA